MEQNNKLFYFLCVAIPLAALFFFTVSCEYIVDPDAPAWGEIVITSSSSETDPEAPGYFSATGVINIEEGAVTDYEWESVYTFRGEGTGYIAETGYVDFTGPGVQENQDLLPRSNLQSNTKNSDGGWYTGLTTMRVYMEQITDYEPIEMPEFSPDMEYLKSVIELEWSDGKLTSMTDYYDYYDGYYTDYYTSEYYYTADSFGIKAQKLPLMKTEYIHDEDTGNLERSRKSVFNGEGYYYADVSMFNGEDFSYTDVAIYAGYDSSGNPDREILYSDDGGFIPMAPEINGTAEVTTIDLWGGEYWPEPGDYFEIYSPNGGYYVWFPDGDSSVDPEPPGLTGIPAVSFDASIMQIIASAVNAVDDFTAFVSAGDDIVITNVLKGNVPDAVPVTEVDLTGQFSITQGSPYVNTTVYTCEYDDNGWIVSLIIDGYEKHTFTYDEDGSVKTLTLALYDSRGEKWVDELFLLFNIPQGIPFDFSDLAPWIDPIGNLMIGTLIPD